MPDPLTRAHLRRMAIAASLTAPTTLGRAIGALGFVQADPIRTPARAQDLILRHRVADYRAGDLQRQFARLRLEEDFLYAYGIMPRDTWLLLHPRHDPDSDGGRHVPTGLAADVLAFVRERGVTHPRDLAERFGRERALNGWGSWSAATTRALQHLHYYGLLRVARRMEDQQDWQPHAAFMTALHADSFVLLVGPLEGTPDVLLIARADNAEQVIARLAGDPWTGSGHLRLRQVAPWTVRLGTLDADQRR